MPIYFSHINHDLTCEQRDLSKDLVLTWCFWKYSACTNFQQSFMGSCWKYKLQKSYWGGISFWCIKIRRKSLHMNFLYVSVNMKKLIYMNVQPFRECASKSCNDWLSLFWWKSSWNLFTCILGKFWHISMKYRVQDLVENKSATLVWSR